MPARIFKPAKTAMQSGQARTQDWVLEFSPDEARYKDPLMGWTGSTDTQAQVRLTFPTKAAAMQYATRHGIAARVSEPKGRKVNIRPGGYGDNFAHNRRGAWTH